MRTLIHVTHEAVQKIGGIGAVLEGLLTSKIYNSEVERSFLLSPLFDTDDHRKFREGKIGEVIYSSLDQITPAHFAERLRPIEERFNVNIVYGRKTLINSESGFKTKPEIILIDVREINQEVLNNFKRKLWEHFGIDSLRYEHIWEYEQYVRLGAVGLEVIEALADVYTEEEYIIIAHEFMGVPTALASIIKEDPRYHSLFYAHEVATVRKIVEEHPGHDVMFYNVLDYARRNNLYIDDVFGPQDEYFKHALVKASKFCDGILAVGDYVTREFKFLAPEFEGVDINLCYNGIPADKITVDEKIASKIKLQLYCERLLGYKPDYIFTHVSRLTVSKGLWRDFLVLNHIEKALIERNKTGVMILLSTELPRRDPKDIRRMEREWDWPVVHREGSPDLSGGETNIYTYVQGFNARARNLKILFINQFGFDRETCGERVPIDVDFWDIRKGTDVEFGQSVYEPFGIAMLEPLPYGGICVVSKICGCVGFLQEVADDVETVITADYTAIEDYLLDIDQLKKIDKKYREEVERRVARKVAERILRKLPVSNKDAERYLKVGYESANKMSWEEVAKRYFIPAMKQALAKRRPVFTA